MKTDERNAGVLLHQRVTALRAEIAAAEAKIPRTREAIRIRQQTLARLEAQLALEGESRPACKTGE
jgi:uncharacterized small protein (DUF1192 family)